MHRQYLSDELIHWTGRGKSDAEAYMVLNTIIDEQILRLSYGPNYVSKEYNPQCAMVCFTDIPLKHSREHCSNFGRFGRFGIAFNKRKMIAYGANPVFYTTKTHFDSIKTISRLLDRMKDLEKDREWRDKLETYQFTEDETVAMLRTVEFLQEYSYKNNDESKYVTYHQREWRLTFNSLPFAGNQNPHAPGTSFFYIRNGSSYLIFRFDPSDIEYIVVPFPYWIKGKKLAKKIGCSLKVYGLSVGR